MTTPTLASPTDHWAALCSALALQEYILMGDFTDGTNLTEAILQYGKNSAPPLTIADVESIWQQLIGQAPPDLKEILLDKEQADEWRVKFDHAYYHGVIHE